MSPETSPQTTSPTTSPTGPAGRDPLVTALAAFAAVALAAAVVMGVLYVRSATSSSAASSPSDTSVEAGFARDMQAHHRQAVTMSLLVLERTDDASVRTLASDIMLTQQAQAGQMAGWLDLWGLPQTGSQPVMAWMEHDDAGTRSGHDGHSAGDTAGMEGMDDDGGASDVVTGVAAMPGMASAEDLARLQAASGTDAERLYLQLMIPHHEAGVEMAEAALTETDDPTVDRLAASIEASQTSELAVLRTLLAERQG